MAPLPPATAFGTPGHHPKKGFVSHYDSSNHITMLFQLHGSVWPKVLPFCVLNMALSLTLVYLSTRKHISLGISSQTHSVLSVIAAFLIVTKVTLSLGRFQEIRAFLCTIYREPRELVQHMAVFTKEQTDPSAVEWRIEVAYRTCVMLRTVMAVVDYDSLMVPAWDLPELTSMLKQDIRESLYVTTAQATEASRPTITTTRKKSWANSMRWGHQEHTLREENSRVPMRVAYLLRNSIIRQRKLVGTPADNYMVESTLFGSVSSFMNAYHG
jgi:hypothetical protein